ncbi:alpha/beta fold hydrolase [Methylobacterium phyllosphaerae]
MQPSVDAVGEVWNAGDVRWRSGSGRRVRRRAAPGPAALVARRCQQFRPGCPGTGPRFPDLRSRTPRFRQFGARPGRPGGGCRPDRRGLARGDRGHPTAGLGNGYGGFVLLLCALRHPDLFDRLVFADCGACFSEPGREAFRGMAGVAGEKGLQAIADTAMRRLFAPAFQAAHPALMADRRAAFLRTDLTVFQGACAALASLDLRPRLSEIRVPALVLVGEHDEATPPAMARELADGLPDSKFVILPDCAHVPQLQKPEMFAKEVMAFLRSHDVP